MYRRTFLLMTSAALFASLVPQRANAAFDPATAGTVIAGAQTVINWFGRSGPSVDQLILQGIEVILKDLQAINLGLEQALVSLHEVIVSVRELPDIIAEKEYHRRAMGAYLGFTEEKGHLAGRIVSEGSAPDIATDFYSAAQKHLDTIQQVRREALWLDGGRSSSIFLTVCMAWSFEIEIATAIKKSPSVLLDMALSYQRWLKAQIETSEPWALNGIRNLMIVELDEQRKKRSEHQLGKDLVDKSGRFEFACWSSRRSTRAGTVHRAGTLIIELPTPNKIGNYLIWFGDEDPKMEFELAFANRGDRVGVFPSMECAKTSVRNDRDSDVQSEKLKAQASEWIVLGREVDAMSLRLAAIEATIDGCKAALVSVERVIGELTSASKVTWIDFG